MVNDRDTESASGEDKRDFPTMDFLAMMDPDCAAAPGAGPIERAFFSNSGRAVHKWHHYLPLYDRYFAAYRARQVLLPFMKKRKYPRFLEIGVQNGGSLQLWRRYFGRSAVIFGIDIDPACAALDGECGNAVRIGSQADPAFLRKVVEEMGGLDIVLDDGSHVASHQRTSFETLFPLLNQGGLYLIEDLHTSYWTQFEGSYVSQRSSVALCKTLIDDMHHWYHPRGQEIAAAQGMVAGLHIHDSMVVIDKAKVAPPVNSFRGARRPETVS